MWLFLALGALLSGAGAVVWRERAKEGTAAPPLFAPSTFTGLERDHVYRVWAKLSSGYGKDEAYDALVSDLSSKLQELGFSEVLLANEDPSDTHVWTFVARWGQDETSGVNAPPLAIYTLEEIADVPASVTYPEPPPVLDTSLSFAEANAVSVALAKERDPARLFAFAQTLAGDFPVAQSLLRAKAGILIKPVTDASTTAFHAIENAGQEAVSGGMAPPMAKAALLAYRAQVEAAP